MSNLTAVHSSYGLLKLILIDSYSEGRVIEFPVEGGTVLTGRNGRGKTTLLQLIPIFYGESPGRIVAAGSNRLDFDHFYLPRITSYIIFEYARPDGNRLVILHSSKHGGEHRYRFARTAYRSELFLLPDGCNILQVGDLQKHFKLHHVDCTNAISSLTDYRGIIQGQAKSGKAWEERRALVANYASVSSGHHLTDIEKIVSGLFWRRTDFRDLQRMVVSCIQDDNIVEIALQTERGKIAPWPGHYAAYQRVMAQKVPLATVLEHEARLIAVETELGCIHARVQRLLHHLETSAADNRVRHQQLTTERDQEENAYQSANREDRKSLDLAENRAKMHQDRVIALDRDHEKWLRDGLPAQEERLEREPALQDALAKLVRRRETLLGEKEVIASRYDRLLQDIRNDDIQARSEAREKRHVLEEPFTLRREGLKEQARTNQDALKDQLRLDVQAIEEQRRALQGERGAMKERLTSPTADPSLVAIHEEKSALVTTLENARRSAEQKEQQCQKALKDAQRACQRQEDVLAQQQRDEKALAHEHEQLLRRQNPPAESLLSFLREQRPDWTLDIAKVIREDLLLREDLSPDVLETLPAIYGVSLDLGAVEAHLAACETELRQAILENEAQRVQQSQERAGAEQALTQREQERKAADRACDEARAQMHRSETQLESARTEQKAAKQRVEASRQEARQHAQAQWDHLDRQDKDAQANRTQRERRCQHDLQECNTRLSTEQAALEAQCKDVLDAHDRAQEARTREIEVQKANCQTERDQALSHAGVETATLTRLEQEAAATRKQLDEINRSRDEVSQWRYWREHEWPRREEYERQASTERKQVRLLRTRIEEADARWKARRAEWQSRRQELDHAWGKLNAERQIIEEQLKRFRAFAPAAEILAQPYDPGWTREALIAQANTHQDASKHLTHTINEQIRLIQQAFVAERETPPFDYYESHRQELHPNATGREYISMFKSWYERDHDELRRTLAIEAQQIAGAIVGFRDKLGTFHRAVQQFNREIQHGLDDNLGFESISRVTVQVKSTIQELKYWFPINDLAEKQGDWLRLAGQDLPPPEFADALSKLLDHWEVRAGIRADLENLIRIEGEVIENGRPSRFRNAQDLKRVSSNGLSYLVLCAIFIAFINRIRGKAKVQIVWALDELRDLDLGNVEALLSVLQKNDITLVSAFPDHDPDVMPLFKQSFSVREGRQLCEIRIAPPESLAIPVEEDAVDA